MTETEADILDELYFVTAFNDLAKALDLDSQTLCFQLQKLVEQGFVKCFFPDPDSEIEFGDEAFKAYCRSYYFLATKAGLLAHNSR